MIKIYQILINISWSDLTKNLTFLKNVIIKNKTVNLNSIFDSYNILLSCLHEFTEKILNFE